LAHLLDDGDLDEYATLIAADIFYERQPENGAPVRYVGRKDFVAAAGVGRSDRKRGPGSHRRHVPTATIVSVEGDVAHAKSQMCIYANASTRPEIVSMVIYTDEFRRVAGKWILQRRVNTPA
jgi:hypothetical protein